MLNPIARSAPQIPDPVLIENPDGICPLVLACDHASNYLPDRFASLGLSPHALTSHIAWDPGALGVARVIGARLDAPLVASGRSRLIIDCNREPGNAGSIPTISEATEIPGNHALDATERQRRVAEIYEPFHGALDRVLAAKGKTSLVSIHSFTPVYRGVARPWHIGVLFDADERLSRLIIERLAARADLTVGVNEPYAPRDGVYHTLDKHAQSHGRPSAMIEIRNDLIATPEDERHWGETLADILAEVLPHVDTDTGTSTSFLRGPG